MHICSIVESSGTLIAQSRSLNQMFSVLITLVISIEVSPPDSGFSVAKVNELNIIFEIESANDLVQFANLFFFFQSIR